MPRLCLAISSLGKTFKVSELRYVLYLVYLVHDIHKIKEIAQATTHIPVVDEQVYQTRK